MRIITPRVHTMIGLVVGALLVAAPVLFGFSDNSAASAVAMWIGIFIVLNELITTSSLSLVKLIPMRWHIMIDVVTGIFLALSPWAFNFVNNDDYLQWVPHLVVGIMVVGYALLTRPADEES